MYQTDRGNYNKKPSIGHAMAHSCLGKIIIIVIAIIVLLFIAKLTVPSEEAMITQTMDNIVQCISENDSIKTDAVDDFVNNIGYSFTYADSAAIDSDIPELFNKYNEISYYPHTFFATTYVHNNFRPEGKRVAIGIFGMVISTVSYSDFILRIDPIHKGYDQKLYKQTIERDEYMGDTPDLDIFKEPTR